MGELIEVQDGAAENPKVRGGHVDVTGVVLFAGG